MLHIIRTYYFHKLLRILIILLPVTVFFIKPGYSQDGNLINLENIRDKKVRKYIEVRNINKLNNFSIIQPSWKKGSTESGFNKNQRIFYLKDKLARVWENYRFADPIKAWKGQYVRVSLLISKGSNSVIYPGISTIAELDTGQVYFLNLKVLKGLYNQPVAFEIINIDPVAKIIEYSYIDDNIEKGKQTIQLFDEGEDLTRIVHTSYYKSDSQFRDNIIYPFFHKKIIKGFHRKMRHLDNKKKQSVIS